MKPGAGIAFAMFLLSAGVAGAEWRTDGKPVPDTEWAKSAGDFGAQLVFTDKPAELFSAWEKPGPAVIYSEAATATRGVPIVAVVFFAGCGPNDKGNCDATVRFQGYGPDGKPWSDPVDGELWVDKPPGKNQMQLSFANMGIVIDPDDSLGVYKVKATVLDRVAKKTLILERTFTAVEAAKK
jgi:hypothetical protein